DRAVHRMSMDLAARRRALLDVLVGHRAVLGDEDVVHLDRLAAGALQADRVPVVDDVQLLTRDQQPATLSWSLDALALDRHGRRQQVTVLHATGEEAPPRPTVAPIHGHDVTADRYDRRRQRVGVAPQLLLGLVRE